MNNPKIGRIDGAGNPLPSSGMTDDQNTEAARIRSTYNFDEVLNVDFNSLSEIAADRYHSIGEFDSNDVFRQHDFRDNLHTAVNSSNDSSVQTEVVREWAFYDKQPEVVTKLESEGGIQHLVQAGVTGNYGTTYTNRATSWLDTLGFIHDVDNGWAKSIDASMPNVTFGKNTYFEFDVSFDEQKTPGFRHSAWLMPATVATAGQPPVLFNDTGEYAGDNAYIGNAADGVEIDIYEHERGHTGSNADFNDTFLMKAIGVGNTNNEYVTTFEGGGTAVVEPGMNSGFKKIGFLWHETEMIWFLDGKPVVKDIDNMPNDVRMYMLLTREATPELFGEDPREPTHTAAFNTDKVKIRSVKVWSVSTSGSSSNAGPLNFRAQRYDATQGEVFWDKPGAGYPVLVYRNGEIQYPSPNNGTSNYYSDLASGVEYEFVLRIANSNQDIIGIITMPAE